MAYVSQEMKKEIAPAVKNILKKFGIKGSLSVRHSSTLVLTVKSGDIDFINIYNRIADKRASLGNQNGWRAETSLDVNPYWFQEHFDGKALEFLTEMMDALKGDKYFDHTDIQTDYFHCSHYVEIKIGRWDTPYILTK